MSKYRKRPVVIEAMQLLPIPEVIAQCVLFVGDKGRWNCSIIQPIIFIKTLEGLMTASTGDYLIKGVNGEFYPCKPDIFKKSYEKVET